MTVDNALLPIGKHFYRIEMGLVYIQLHRNVELQETIELTNLFERAYAKDQRLFLICDLLHATNFEADARKYFGQWAKNIKVFAIASIGRNILQRAISVFMLNAIKIFAKGYFAQAYFDNEAEARKWLSKQRPSVEYVSKKNSPSHH
jgi:hypothetical protein